MKIQTISIMERARRYVAMMPEAISGQHGHSTMFSVACVLVQGFDLNMGDARMLLEEYNTTLTEPFSQGQLEHKLQDAVAKESIKGRGYLLNPSDKPIHVRITPKKPANTPPRVMHRIASRTPGTGVSYSADKIKHSNKHDIPDRESKAPVPELVNDNIKTLGELEKGVPPVPRAVVDVSDPIMELAGKFARELSGRILASEEVDVPADYWAT